MVASDWTMQALADMLQAPVDRPAVLETTALGAAWLAGRHAGVYADVAEFARAWARERRFEPQGDGKSHENAYRGWRRAVESVLLLARQD